MPGATETLMTVNQVAERLQVSPLFVYRLLASGRLKHYTLGAKQGGKRISEAHLTEYLEGAERGEPAEEAPKARRRKREFKHLSL